MLIPAGTDPKGSYYSLLVINHDGSVIWKGPKDLNAMNPLVFGEWDMGVCLPETIGDIDGDGFPELIAAAPQSDISPTTFRLLRWMGGRFKPVLTSTLLESPPGSGRFSWSGNEQRFGAWISGFEQIGPQGRVVVKVTEYTGGSDAKIYSAILQREAYGFSLIRKLIDSSGKIDP